MSRWVIIIFRSILSDLVGSTLFIIKSIKRELKTRPIYDCRCDERLEFILRSSTDDFFFILRVRLNLSPGPKMSSITEPVLQINTSAAELPRPELTAEYQVIQLNHKKSDRKSEMFYVHPFKNIFF